MALQVAAETRDMDPGMRSPGASLKDSRKAGGRSPKVLCSSQAYSREALLIPK